MLWRGLRTVGSCIVVVGAHRHGRQPMDRRRQGGPSGDRARPAPGEGGAWSGSRRASSYARGRRPSGCAPSLERRGAVAVVETTGGRAGFVV
ncbi:hypothetical protein G5V59_22315 [Nocardioides sp. W3-2-3]|uniref:hypothetical protein n=1 Tax=Nocardioides convexus TaxID=2712224 RepID=UPI002418BC27|nr:hypothetical protein [Nocardioides convexus]NHA01589.1 hypothetical protein [Nocardioides convexus]